VKLNSEVGEEWMGAGLGRTILSHFVVLVSRDSAEKKCNQTITGPTYGADCILEIHGQKWRALPTFLHWS
jgi:hypothetical protein